jgi:hypothetical protein
MFAHVSNHSPNDCSSCLSELKVVDFLLVQNDLQLNMFAEALEIDINHLRASSEPGIDDLADAEHTALTSKLDQLTAGDAAVICVSIRTSRGSNTPAVQLPKAVCSILQGGRACFCDGACACDVL